jgi:glutathione-specific gamma-glutamylcyclotransferase
MWVFGYGSLVWRPSIPFVERRPAYVEGWSRRFWQGSTDHRGVPGAPGRVVTLIEEPGAVCWGVAYQVAASDQEAVLAALDHREKGGYQRRDLAIRFREHDPVPGLVYVATPGNPNYLGTATLEEIAAQVRASSGPSGFNLEYVESLARALREMDAADEHVFALAELLRQPSPSR